MNTLPTILLYSGARQRTENMLYGKFSNPNYGEIGYNAYCTVLKIE